MPDTLARVSYVGNRGAKQSQMLELNNPTPEYVHYMTTHEPLPAGGVRRRGAAAAGSECLR